MSLAVAAAGLATLAALVSVAPRHRSARWVAALQGVGAVAVVAWHLSARVRWEIDLRRSRYLVDRARGELLDRGVTLLVAASFLCVALAVAAWIPGAPPRRIRAMAAAVAGLCLLAGALVARA